MTSRSDIRAAEKREARHQAKARRRARQTIRIQRDRALGQLATQEGRRIENGRVVRVPLAGNDAYAKARATVYESFQEKLNAV